MNNFKHDLNNPQLSISPSEKSFSSSIHRDFISNELLQQLLGTNVLIVPNEGYGDRTDLIYFPAGTSDLHQYLTERGGENVLVGVCIEDNDYKELSLHADWMIIAEFVVKDLVAPLVVALIAEYIVHTLTKRLEKTNVKSKLVVVDDEDEHRVEYYYEGPASEYKDVMLNAISNFRTMKSHHSDKEKKRSKKEKKERGV